MQANTLYTSQPKIMGIVNVTPDSFSDGGHFSNTQKAIEHGLRLVEDGADILDIGGESTRPGAQAVSIDEELDRVLPVIKALSDKGVFVSIDTRRTKVMDEALKAGAQMVNDVNALQDEGAVNIVAAAGCYVCLMHMQGEPKKMQENPVYNDVVEEVFSFLEQRIKLCSEAGISKNKIIADCGIGFGKTQGHNVELLKNLSRFQDLGVPHMLGASRKSFIGKIDSAAINPSQRIGGSLVSVVEALRQNVTYFRVHDVFETRQAIKVFHALN